MKRKRVEFSTFVLALISVVFISTSELFRCRLGPFEQSPNVSASSHTVALVGYVFSEAGDYVTVDPQSYKISEKANLFTELFGSGKQDTKFKAFVNSRLIQVVTDQRERRAYVLAGIPKLELLLGYIVLSLDNIRPVSAIRQEMRFGTAQLAVDSTRHKVYLSYIRPERDREAVISSVTTVYDSQNNREIGRFESSGSRIQGWTCLSEDGGKLYANDQFFDTTSGARAPESFSGKPFLATACQEGYILLLSKSKDGTTLLSVLDTRSDRVIRQVDTSIPFSADIDGWTFSRDAKLIIFDEKRLVRIGAGQAAQRTGLLISFNVPVGIKAGEVQLQRPGAEGGGILDFSLDGSKVLYRSDNKVFVISLAGMSVLAEISFPFQPIGIIWP